MLRSIALKALWSEWTVGWFAFQWAFAKWHLSTRPSCVKGLFEDQVASYGLLICHNQWACWKSLDTLRIIYRGANILPECVFRARSVYPVTRIFNVTFSYTWRNEQFRATLQKCKLKVFEDIRPLSNMFGLYSEKLVSGAESVSFVTQTRRNWSWSSVWVGFLIHLINKYRRPMGPSFLRVLVAWSTYRDIVGDGGGGGGGWLKV